ncbi:integrase arm-type DNA-binding domain-containing protein, partial [uncultured Parasutterella sp.]|uniref:tyrosine-type recombinase/integrase n=1 Tax=uncultured Parasutterella sp. TaxID=1263098 RepID=UPI002603957A
MAKAIDGTYAIGGVEGLCIRIRDNKCKFVLRYTLDGTRHVLTLGDRSVLSLSAARKIALEKKLLIVKNQDPVALRKLERSSKQTQPPRKNKNFEFVAKQFIAERQKNGYWRYNRKNGALQSMRLLERYAFPKIGELSVNSLTSEITWNLIKPIWTTKTNTAQKLLTLVRQICNWAIAHNIRRFKDNPADLKTSLGVLLEPLKYARKPKQNHAAASVEDLPEIFARLHKLHSVSAKAAEFAILTAARSSAVRFATWDEFDLEKGIWRIPLEHDKSKLQKRDRTIFLSKEAIALLKNLCRLPESPLVFNGFDVLLVINGEDSIPPLQRP